MLEDIITRRKLLSRTLPSLAAILSVFSIKAEAQNNEVRISGSYTDESLNTWHYQLTIGENGYLNNDNSCYNCISLYLEQDGKCIPTEKTKSFRLYTAKPFGGYFKDLRVIDGNEGCFSTSFHGIDKSVHVVIDDSHNSDMLEEANNCLHRFFDALPQLKESVKKHYNLK